MFKLKNLGYQLLVSLYYKSWRAVAFVFFGLPLIGSFMAGKWFWRERGSLILVYHELPGRVFERHLSYLKRHWNVVSLDQLIKGLNQPQTKRRTIAITFDDGYKSNFSEVFPVVLRHNIPITIYLVSGVCGTNQEFWFHTIENLQKLSPIIPDVSYFKSVSDSKRNLEIKELSAGLGYKPKVERDALSWQEARKMLESGLVSFGSHTRTHPCLINMPAEKAREEITGSKADLEAALGIQIRHFSYPNGDYERLHIKACQQCGYLTGATAQPGVNTANTDLFQLKRVLIEPDEKLPGLAMKITGLGHRLGLNRFTLKHLRHRGMPC